MIALTARLEQRIAALRETIAAAERKRAGIEAAIASRNNRLLAASALRGSGAAPSRDE